MVKLTGKERRLIRSINRLKVVQDRERYYTSNGYLPHKVRTLLDSIIKQAVIIASD